MMRRCPVLTSTVTAMPGVRLTSLSSICMALAPSETRAAKTKSCGFEASFSCGLDVFSFDGSGVIASPETWRMRPERSP